MKLKNLFLVGLAAMAMASCSNENDPIENGGGNLESNAKMQFSFAMPGNVSTRADVETDPGTKEESAIATVNVRIQYTTGADGLYHFVLADFTKAKDSNTYTLKAEKYMSVRADNAATVYVTVNGDENVNLTGTKTETYDLATASIITGVAKSNNFLMTGSVPSVQIIAGSTENTTGLISVSRVAARIDEITETVTDNQFTFTTVYKKDGVTYDTKEETLTATIQGYSLSNLNQITNIFPRTLPTGSYFQPLVINQDNAEVLGVKKAIGSSQTYCLENESEQQPTYVTYKVSYTYNVNGIPTALGTFYVYQEKLYTSFEDLDNSNGNIFSSYDLKADSPYNDFITKGVRKYESGIAYYTKPIKTAETANKIVRNNVYKLKVSNIKSLGDAVIDEKEEGKVTLLQLEISVTDWTVNSNDFEL